MRLRMTQRVSGLLMIECPKNADPDMAIPQREIVIMVHDYIILYCYKSYTAHVGRFVLQREPNVRSESCHAPRLCDEVSR